MCVATVQLITSCAEDTQHTPFLSVCDVDEFYFNKSECTTQPNVWL